MASLTGAVQGFEKSKGTCGVELVKDSANFPLRYDRRCDAEPIKVKDILGRIKKEHGITEKKSKTLPMGYMG